MKDLARDRSRLSGWISGALFSSDNRPTDMPPARRIRTRHGAPWPAARTDERPAGRQMHRRSSHAHTISDLAGGQSPAGTRRDKSLIGSICMM